jgi:hypothetical protein
LFAAMRRALVIAGVMLAGLLALAPALAMAAPPPPEKELPPEEEFFEEEEVGFTLLVEGFTVDLSAGRGDRTATLSISRGGLTSTYQVPATITDDDSVRAKFGSFGRLNFHFVPKKGAQKCLGKLTFAGSFTFTGENGYVHIDADAAEGSRSGGGLLGCVFEEEEPGGIVEDDDVHFEAIAGAFKRGDGRRVGIEGWQAPSGRGTVELTASRIEEKEGVRISRGATLRTSASVFHGNPNAGTATLKPPAPFTGWARLVPGREGEGIWEGTLRVPTLSGKPIELTGPAFRAHFLKEGAFDE